MFCFSPVIEFLLIYWMQIYRSPFLSCKFLGEILTRSILNKGDSFEGNFWICWKTVILSSITEQVSRLNYWEVTFAMKLTEM